MTKEVLDMIWTSRKNKHEAIVKAIDDLIIDLVIDMPSDLISYMFERIQ
jgi:hypothetical protein